MKTQEIEVTQWHMPKLFAEALQILEDDYDHVIVKAFKGCGSNLSYVNDSYFARKLLNVSDAILMSLFVLCYLHQI